MNTNPYSAPASTVGDIASALPVVPAGKWRRLFNLLIDYVGMIAAGAVIGGIYALIGGEEAIAALDRPNMLRDYALGIAGGLLYYTPLEALFGCTLGKLVTGTRVVNEQGGPITWGQALGRSLCRFIPFEPFSVLFSTDGEARGWHDRLPRTYVVRRRGVESVATPGAAATGASIDA